MREMALKNGSGRSLLLPVGRYRRLNLKETLVIGDYHEN